MDILANQKSIRKEPTLKEEKRASFELLFSPKSVAIVGASRRKGSVGFSILKNMIDNYKGDLYAVNPKADEILGLKCYPTIKDIGKQVDLAVLILPSLAILAAFKECIDGGVKAVIVISAGFKETGKEGAALEKELAEMAQKNNIPLMGPNCLGLINTDPKVKLNASFAQRMPDEGNIAFLSQSGALCTAVLDYAKGENIGFSKFVSFGNKADIDELCFLEYLKDDPKTKAILMYVEDLVDGQAFIELAREITGEQENKKPIIAIKSGRTAQGAKAASSHTGSLAGSDSAYNAIFEQSGVIRAESLEEMFNLAIGLSSPKLPKGDRVAIVTNAGGPGIMATDACIGSGLQMPVLKPETQEELKKVLPPTANFSNPVDVIGDAFHDRYEHALRCVINDPNIDAILVILTPQAMTEIKETAQTIVDINKTTDKTIFACFMGAVDVLPGVKILEDNHIPQYRFPELAAKTLSAMVRFKKWGERSKTKVVMFKTDNAAARAIINEARQNGQRLLTVEQSLRVLQVYGFSMPVFHLAKSASEASKKAKEIGFPVAMKIVSPDIIHKLDVGGVKINLQNGKEVETEFQEMMKRVAASQPKAKVDGILIQAMGKKGREVILGMDNDPHFGPLIMFGLGGTFVEVFKDVTFRLAPIREASALGMIESIRAYSVLKGVRGQKPADIEAIKNSLLRLSQLSCELTDVVEIDINPLMVYDAGEGAHVIDARLILKS